MSNTNTEVLTTAYEKLQGALTQSNTVLPKLEEAVEKGNLDNYATVSSLEEKAKQSDVNTLNARVDNLTTLAEGSTTGDAELIDARTVNGSTYTNLGGAVRALSSGDAIQDDSINPFKTSFIKNSGNLFNKNTVLTNTTLNFNTGVTRATDGYYTTDYIPVTGISKITRGKVGSLNTAGGCWYNCNKEFISGFANGTVNPLTVPSGASYLKISISWIDELMIVAGETLPAEYISYYFKFDKSSTKYPLEFVTEEDIPDNSISTSNLKNSVVTFEKTDFIGVGKNKYNYKTAKEGYYIRETTGLEVAGEGYYCSDFIEVNQDSIYTSSMTGQSAFYDENKEYISKITFTDGTFTTPSNCKYIRVSAYDTSKKSEQMVVEGDTLPSVYEDFYYTIKSTDEKPFKVSNSSESSSRWRDKYWYVIGDSISNYNKYQPIVSKMLGCSYYNGGVAGTTYVSWIRDNRISESECKKADVITIFLGTNDFASCEIGTLESTDVTTTSGAFKKMIETIYTYNSNVRIGIILPLQRFDNTTNAHDSTKTLLDFVNIIKENAKLLGLPVLNLYETSGLNKYTISTYTTDNLHPNNDFFSEIKCGGQIAKFIESI